MSTKKYVSLEKLSLYDEKIKKVISDGDAAALASAKQYFEDNVDRFDVAGAAASALAEAKTYADGKDVAIAEAKKAGTDAAAAAGVADGKAVAAQEAAEAAQADVDALELYVGTIPEGATSTNVVAYVQEKTSGIASEGAMTELSGRVGVVEGKVAAIEGDYLKTADKTALSEAIAAEQERAEGIEAGLRTDVDAIKGDYLKAADKTELQGNIDTLTGVVNTLRDGVDAEKIDGVKDLIDYVEEHGAEVTGMKEDIAENAEAISGVAGKVTTLEGEMDAVETAYEDLQTDIDSNVKPSIWNLTNRFEVWGGDNEKTVDAMIADAVAEEAAARDAAIADAQAAAEATSAADATSKANAAEAAAKSYTDAEIDKVEAVMATMQTAIDGKAASSDLTALAGRVTTVEGKVSTLETEMDAVEAKALANEGAISTLNTTVAGKASQSDLDSAVARIAANEAGLASFVEVSEQEILDLFA